MERRSGGAARLPAASHWLGGAVRAGRGHVGRGPTHWAGGISTGLPLASAKAPACIAALADINSSLCLWFSSLSRDFPLVIKR